jgi:hypothetical protein
MSTDTGCVRPVLARIEPENIETVDEKKQQAFEEEGSVGKAIAEKRLREAKARTV